MVLYQIKSLEVFVNREKKSAIIDNFQKIHLSHNFIMAQTDLKVIVIVFCCLSTQTILI